MNNRCNEIRQYASVRIHRGAVCGKSGLGRWVGPSEASPLCMRGRHASVDCHPAVLTSRSWVTSRPDGSRGRRDRDELEGHH